MQVLPLAQQPWLIFCAALERRNANDETHPGVGSGASCGIPNGPGLGPAISPLLPLAPVVVILASSKSAREVSWVRDGRLNLTLGARRRETIVVAMIGLLQGVRPRVSEAAALTRSDAEKLRAGLSCARVGDAGGDNYRVVRTETMQLLFSVRRGAGEDELVFAMRPN